MKSKSYIVCSTVRSGSTLLCKTLEQLDRYGRPQEYFHRHTIQRLGLNNNPDKFLNYCHTICQDSLTHHGVFGVKMHWPQLLDFLSLARQSPQFQHQEDLAILDDFFPNLTFIYLRRRNITAQAVSAAIASQTGKWEKTKALSDNSKESREIRKNPLKFQPWRIYEWDKALQEHNRCWQNFFAENNLDYHETCYEDLVESFPQEMAQIVDYISVNSSEFLNKFEMPTKPQSTPINRRFIRYYSWLPEPFLVMLYRLYRQLRPVQEEVGS